jgi:hypothetical protein
MVPNNLSELLLKTGLVSHDVIYSSEGQEYIKTLTGTSFEEIEKTPEILRIEKLQMDKEWLEVTTNDYKSFLSAHEHLRELNSLIVKLPENLQQLSASIPEIVTKLDSCQTIHKDSLLSRKSLLLLSNQLEEIEPILEIPVLFDTLIRNNHYEEAMDLQLFTQRLPHRYPEVPFLKTLATYKTSSQAMLNQLFSMLKGPAKLPLLIRVIGYLRRLGFNDTTLGVLFLSLRYEYLKQLHLIIKEPNVNDYVRRWIEIQRENMFDIVAHYKAIFPITSTSNEKDLQILGSFAIDAIQGLYKTVEKFLNDLDDVSYLPSLNTQIMYYGLSLGRIGMDFRPLFVGLFEDTVLRVVTNIMKDASEAFVINSVRIERPGKDAKNIDLLLCYYPLAVAFNQYMNALNQLRYLPCKSLHSKLANVCMESLGVLVGKVAHGYNEEKRTCGIVAWVLRDCVIPDVCKGLDSVLGSESVTNYNALVTTLTPYVKQESNQDLAPVPEEGEGKNEEGGKEKE